MLAGRRYVFLAAGVGAAWFVFVFVFWALRSPSDVVPVGVDYNRQPPTAASVAVACNGLFDGRSRGNSSLPVLAVQPKGKPALAFQREPCALVHRQGRVVFLLDAVVFVGFVTICGWFVFRRRTSLLAQTDIDRRVAEVGSS